MKQQLFNFALRLLLFTLLLFGLQFFITHYFFDPSLFYYSLYAIYLFHFIATLLIFVILVYIYHNFQDNTGFAFMGASLFKMLAAVIFLLPMMLNNTGNAFFNLIAFFIPYFLFLLFETYYAVKLINTK